jgi:hypothetical protein
MATNRDIKYLNKDFSDFRSQLINFSQTYFPDTYTDFSPASPGMMFMEQSAYVGDVLSFYLDNQIQENFLQYARQDNNLYELAYMFGYKPKNTGLASVTADFFQLIPAKTIAGIQYPDYDYSLYIEESTQLTSNTGVKFILEDPVDFTVSNSIDNTTVSIAQISGNEPTYYLLKKSRNVISGEISTTTFTFGEYEEFPTVELNVSNLGYILDIIDSEGNKWYEVDYLGQELVFDGIKNNNINDPNNYENVGDSPYILKTKQVQRRFATRFINKNTLQIQFGSGKPGDNDEDVIPNPDNVGLGLPFQKSKLTTAYSPTNFIFTNTYGIAPSNTTLTVRYISGGGVQSNIPANSLTNLDTSNVKFIKSNLNDITANYIFSSIATNNEAAASGGQDGDTIEELRQNTISNFNSQLRNVTADDYLVRALSMSPKYGIISKAHVQKPQANEGNSTLDMYVLSYDLNKKLVPASSTLKNNLKTYINQYRMIGDSLNIKDGFVINIGCEFEILTKPNFNNNEVLSNCIQAVQGYFEGEKWQINQPIIYRDITILLDTIEGVQTVKSVKVLNKTGTNSGYSKYAYDIEGATQNGVIYPSIDPSIFEVKFPNEDIKGRIVTL